jgi:hypothetical protein
MYKGGAERAELSTSTTPFDYFGDTLQDDGNAHTLFCISNPWTIARHESAFG